MPNASSSRGPASFRTSSTIISVARRRLTPLATSCASAPSGAERSRAPLAARTARSDPASTPAAIASAPATISAAFDAASERRPRRVETGRQRCDGDADARRRRPLDLALANFRHQRLYGEPACARPSELPHDRCLRRAVELRHGGRGVRDLLRRGPGRECQRDRQRGHHDPAPCRHGCPTSRTEPGRPKSSSCAAGLRGSRIHTLSSTTNAYT